MHTSEAAVIFFMLCTLFADCRPGGHERVEAAVEQNLERWTAKDSNDVPDDLWKEIQELKRLSNPSGKEFQKHSRILVDAYEEEAARELEEGAEERENYDEESATNPSRVARKAKRKEEKKRMRHLVRMLELLNPEDGDGTDVLSAISQGISGRLEEQKKAATRKTRKEATPSTEEETPTETTTEETETEPPPPKKSKKSSKSSAPAGSLKGKPECTSEDECDDGDPATKDSCIFGKCTHMKTEVLKQPQHAFSAPVAQMPHSGKLGGQVGAIGNVVTQMQPPPPPPTRKCLTDKECDDDDACTRDVCFVAEEICVYKRDDQNCSPRRCGKQVHCPFDRKCWGSCLQCPGYNVDNGYGECISSCADIGRFTCGRKQLCVKNCTTDCETGFTLHNHETSLCAMPSAISCGKVGLKFCPSHKTCVTACAECANYELDGSSLGVCIHGTRRNQVDKDGGRYHERDRHHYDDGASGRRTPTRSRYRDADRDRRDSRRSSDYDRRDSRGSSRSRSRDKGHSSRPFFGDSGWERCWEDGGLWCDSLKKNVDDCCTGCPGHTGNSYHDCACIKSDGLVTALSKQTSSFDPTKNFKKFSKILNLAYGSSPPQCNVTYVIPIDTAWMDLPAGVMDAIETDKEVAKAFVDVHLWPGFLTTSTMLMKKQVTVEVGGTEQHIGITRKESKTVLTGPAGFTDNGKTFNNAKVVAPDQQAGSSSAMFHSIDYVLRPAKCGLVKGADCSAVQVCGSERDCPIADTCVEDSSFAKDNCKCESHSDGCPCWRLCAGSKAHAMLSRMKGIMARSSAPPPPPPRGGRSSGGHSDRYSSRSRGGGSSSSSSSSSSSHHFNKNHGWETGVDTHESHRGQGKASRQGADGMEGRSTGKSRYSGQGNGNCKTDADCDDHDDCTRDVCTLESVCDHMKTFKTGCREEAPHKGSSGHHRHHPHVDAQHTLNPTSKPPLDTSGGTGGGDKPEGRAHVSFGQSSNTVTITGKDGKEHTIQPYHSKPSYAYHKPGETVLHKADGTTAEMPDGVAAAQKPTQGTEANAFSRRFGFEDDLNKGRNRWKNKHQNKATKQNNKAEDMMHAHLQKDVKLARQRKSDIISGGGSSNLNTNSHDETKHKHGRKNRDKKHNKEDKQSKPVVAATTTTTNPPPKPSFSKQSTPKPTHSTTKPTSKTLPHLDHTGATQKDSKPPPKHELGHHTGLGPISVPPASSHSTDPNHSSSSSPKPSSNGHKHDSKSSPPPPAHKSHTSGKRPGRGPPKPQPTGGGSSVLDALHAKLHKVAAKKGP